MNGVLGLTHLAMSTCRDDEGKAYLKLVEEAGRTLLSIINDILDLSKIEAGRVELGSEPFRLREVAASTVKALETTAQAKGLALGLSIDAGCADALVGDPGRLRQVLTNLVGNAIKFTERGVVAVTVSPAVDQPSSPECVLLRFAIEDTGIGIPADKLDTVFEPFTSEVGPGFREHGGTGLGLAISRKLVAMMGGRLWAESRPGLGSTFSFTAEFGRDGEERIEDAGGTRGLGRQPAGPLKVLLVEDNQINQVLAAELLKRRGHAVTVASNGREALEALGREDFSLVLMDARMPVMSGEEATRHVRAGEARDPHIPIVALTAHALQGDRERFLAAGMDDYLAKPIDLRELDTVMERVMARHSQ
jgi:CheY-like chemotaxis protein